ncbi:MAG TPA: hypothetical protein VEQ63_14440 [Bryobacteraceae bacterium]|nr:hypothetical protein [Bryobacteraceae bacterium]
MKFLADTGVLLTTVEAFVATPVASSAAGWSSDSNRTRLRSIFTKEKLKTASDVAIGLAQGTNWQKATSRS